MIELKSVTTTEDDQKKGTRKSQAGRMESLNEDEMRVICKLIP